MKTQPTDRSSFGDFYSSKILPRICNAFEQHYICSAIHIIIGRPYRRGKNRCEWCGGFVPLKSKAQFIKLKELEKQGKVKAGTADQWMAETPNYDKLPERVKQKPKHHRRNQFPRTS